MRIVRLIKGLLYVGFVCLAIAVLCRIVKLQYFEIPDSSITAKVTREDIIECTRGSILADDGRYLAFSIPEYRLAMDPCQAVDTTFDNGIDELSKRLASFYKDKKASDYKKSIVEAREEGKRFLYINRRLLTYQEMKEISTFPIFCRGIRGGGVQFEKIDHRTYPYGDLAYRTLGYIKSQDEKPTIGIEGSCDSILRGTPGIQPMRRTEHNNWIADFDRERIDPINGTDVQVTINIDFQDIAQNVLLDRLGMTDQLSAGTVVIMEVETGEIKAMVNLEKRNGSFNETYNYAVGRVGEPGSVFKAATMAVLLEDKKITLDTELPAIVNWSYQGHRLPADEDLVGMSSVSVIKGFEISSNNVFRMLAANNYGSNPQEFIDKLEKLKIAENFDFDIKGLGKAHIKSPSDKGWSPIDLPQIGMGYTVELTPLHTLNYYNAVANDGVMVKPHLIRNYQKDGVVVKEFPTETMTTIASPENVKELQRAMRGVVERGTGKTVFKDFPVAVAGKTGTARIVIPGSGRYEDNNGNKMYQATFVGFFPYEKPRYSMIVVVYSVLSKTTFFGASWAAPVFRDIAAKIYASSVDWNDPVTKSGTVPTLNDYRELDIAEGIVPDVIGMGLKDALHSLESNGYEVNFEGNGKIVEQIPTAGDTTDIKKIKLRLSVN